MVNLPDDVARVIYRKSINLRNELIAKDVENIVRNITTEVRECPTVSKKEITTGQIPIKVISVRTSSFQTEYEKSTTTTVKRKCIFSVGGKCFMLEHCAQLTNDEMYEGFHVYPIVSAKNTWHEYRPKDPVVDAVQKAVCSSYGFNNYAACMRGKIRTIMPGEFKLVKEPKQVIKKYPHHTTLHTS